MIATKALCEPQRTDPATSAEGGDGITTIHVATNRRSEKVHAIWDVIPESLQSSCIDPAWLALARNVPLSRGAIEDKSTNWANETLTHALNAVQALTFGAQTNGHWTVPLNGLRRLDGADQKGIFRPRLARLAQTLRALCNSASASQKIPPEDLPAALSVGTRYPRLLGKITVLWPDVTGPCLDATENGVFRIERAHGDGAAI